MSSFLSRLDGWQRLWLVSAIICLILTSIFVVIGQKKLTAVEDEAILAKLNADDVKRVEIPGLGKVEFPNDMHETDIEALIKSHYDSNRDTIRILAADLMAERNKKQAAEARGENNKVRESNNRLILFAYLGWLIVVVVVYLLGYAISWIYHGFKKS